MIPLIVPELGLPNDEAIVVSCWLVRRGDVLVEGDRVVELLIGEMTFDVPAPATGKLVHVTCEVDETVGPGTILGRIQPEKNAD